MTTAIRTSGAPSSTGRAPSAAVYVDSDHAIVARTTIDGAIAVTDIRRRRPEDLSYVIRIVDEIGERERVVIVGPDEARLEVEREYVTVFHRPDVLVDVEPSAHETAAQVISRLERLAS
jgi:hypothetical protein